MTVALSTIAQPNHALMRSDQQTCRSILRKGSRSFSLASWLLPSRIRDDVTALYAFCRVADDEIDLGAHPELAAAALRQRIDALVSGCPHDHAVDRALSRVVQKHQIPPRVLHAVIEGFEWDNAVRTYADLDELHGYCARVASTVGVMMSLIMGVREPELLARACDLGVAMQLTNIARDVGEDARAGRVYLPLSWLDDPSFDLAAWQQDPQPHPVVQRAVERLLAHADRMYARADAGIEGLPRDCRSAIYGARVIYSAIGDEIRERSFDSVSGRAFVSTGRKLRLMLRALWRPPGKSPARCLPALAETAFLVEAVKPKRSPA